MSSASPDSKFCYIVSDSHSWNSLGNTSLFLISKMTAAEAIRLIVTGVVKKINNSENTFRKLLLKS